MTTRRAACILAITTLGLSAACTRKTAEPQGETVPEPTKSQVALDYEKSCNDGLASARAAFEALEKIQGDKTIATVLEPMNELWRIVDAGLNTAQLYRNVHPDEALRGVADNCEQEFQKIVTNIGLSRPLFDAVSAIDASKEDAVTRRYVEHVLRDFRRAGVDKDDATRKKIRAMREELVKIGQTFNKNIREDVRSIQVDSAAELDGLPADYIEAHQPGKDGKITITTDYPDYIPFATYATSDKRRLEIYKEFRKRGHPKNEAVLNELLQKRYELSRLLGYENWAHYVTEDKMIKTARNARDFIEKVADVSKARAQRDYDELLGQLRKSDPKAKKVGDWQKSFLEEQLKKDKYQFDSQALRAYFPYRRVKQGILDLTAKMFGVTFTQVDVPVWHEDVEAFELRDGEELIGRFYLDMHPRDGKYKHAAAFTIKTGVVGKQVPEAALVCNFPGGDDDNALMEHNDVETFFHEFGHLLHHLFGGKHRWLGVSGFNTEWDFVEAPSQMLEEWAWDGTSLNTFAKNDKGEPIPDALINQMRRARDFGKGLWVRHQMFYASVSLNYYDRDAATVDTTALMKELQEQYSPFDYVDDTYFQLSFGHLDGYSAIYYTYMWSLVIAKDLFSVFEKQGMLDAEPARRYRQKILEPGGSKDAAVMVREFLDREYTFDSFARWLNGA